MIQVQSVMLTSAIVGFLRHYTMAKKGDHKLAVWSLDYVKMRSGRLSVVFEVNAIFIYSRLFFYTRWFSPAQRALLVFHSYIQHFCGIIVNCL